MKFYFPDSMDLVDPSFDFITERRSTSTVDRQLRYRYAHEVFPKAPYDGMLVSKSVVDGDSGGSGRYSQGNRRRVLFRGIREFLRLENPDIKVMGDNGAFTYVNEEEPPVTVEEVISFYEECDFDFGFSVDHMILQYDEDLDIRRSKKKVPEEWDRRQKITFDLGRQFFKQCKKDNVSFKPIGVAQGWSPKSYAKAVKTMQRIGYDYIALGGMVPLKTEEVMRCLEAIDEVRDKKTKLHLLGVSRIANVKNFDKLGVHSFDSTSPLRQAFKEDLDNYYTTKRNYSAIRVPQVEGNQSLRRRIQAGEVKQEVARRLEKACMKALVDFDNRKGRRSSVVDLLAEYQEVYGSRRDYTEQYEQTLTDKPWKNCKCAVCKALGIHVIIFRGAERNRRRGFHNIYVTFQSLKKRRRYLQTA